MNLSWYDWRSEAVRTQLQSHCRAIFRSATNQAFRLKSLYTLVALDRRAAESVLSAEERVDVPALPSPVRPQPTLHLDTDTSQGSGAALTQLSDEV